MYFEKQGKQNTEKTIALAFQAAKELSIHNVVLATVTGETADCIPETEGVKVTCVTCSYGYKTPGVNEMPEEKRAQLISRGFSVCSAANVLSGAERAFSNRFAGVGPLEIVSHTLRIFGQGMKVCVEVATMAADGGYIPVGEPIIVIAGTGGGADTAVIMRAANAHSLLNTKIDRILCKPIVKDEDNQ